MLLSSTFRRAKPVLLSRFIASSAPRKAMLFGWHLSVPKGFGNYFPKGSPAEEAVKKDGSKNSNDAKNPQNENKSNSSSNKDNSSGKKPKDKKASSSEPPKPSVAALVATAAAIALVAMINSSGESAELVHEIFFFGVL